MTLDVIRQLRQESCDEVAHRYFIFNGRQADQKQLEYRSVMDPHSSKHVTYTPSAQVDNRKNTMRYFQCFYNSFLYSEQRKLRELLDVIVISEAQIRYQLFQMEQECIAVICRSMAPFLAAVIPSLPFANALFPQDDEQVDRNMILYDYYQMLQEAVVIQEVLHRRCVVFIEEPTERWQIEGSEPSGWIAARRSQVEREEMVKTGCMTLDHKRVMDYIKWYSQQQNQITLFERREMEERMDVERLERLNAGIIADSYASDFRELRYQQLKYELGKRCLNENDVKKLNIDEVTARSHIVFEQFDKFKSIKGSEVKHFLATRRNCLINETVECLHS